MKKIFLLALLFGTEVFANLPRINEVRSSQCSSVSSSTYYTEFCLAIVGGRTGKEFVIISESVPMGAVRRAYEIKSSVVTVVQPKCVECKPIQFSELKIQFVGLVENNELKLSTNARVQPMISAETNRRFTDDEAKRPEFLLSNASASLDSSKADPVYFQTFKGIIHPANP